MMYNVLCMHAKLILSHSLQSQYIFLHDALKELIVCGETEIHAHTLTITVNNLKQHTLSAENEGVAKGEEDTPTGFQKQFKVIKCTPISHNLNYGALISKIAKPSESPQKTLSDSMFILKFLKMLILAFSPT